MAILLHRRGPRNLLVTVTMVITVTAMGTLIMWRRVIIIIITKVVTKTKGSHWEAISVIITTTIIILVVIPAVVMGDPVPEG